MTSVIIIAVCAIVQELITKMGFLCQIDFFCLRLICTKILFVYKFLNNLTNSNCNYRCYKLQSIYGPYNFRFEVMKNFYILWHIVNKRINFLLQRLPVIWCLIVTLQNLVWWHLQDIQIRIRREFDVITISKEEGKNEFK